MNLHAIVAPAIGFVNPHRTVLYRQSAGFTKTADFKQVPAYVNFPATVVQLQALSAKEVQHLDALNIQGVMKSLYMNGDAQGVVRPLAKGGDLFVIDGQTWLVVQVLETWPDWCKVAICLQGAA